MAVSKELVVPTERELEVLSPKERWNLEDTLSHASDQLRDYNDEELRQWVEVEGKTQTQIAKLVGRTQARISQRCSDIGIEIPTGKGTAGGRPRKVISPNNSNGEVIDAEVVEPEEFAGGHYGPDALSEGWEENARVQLVHWFERGADLQGLLDEGKPLEAKTDSDREWIKDQADEMTRLAKRIKKEVR